MRAWVGPPVGGLVGATAQVDGELGHVCVGARQHWQQLHEVQRPHVAVETPVGPLLQAELGNRGLELGGQPHRHHPGGLGAGERGERRGVGGVLLVNVLFTQGFSVCSE